MRANELAARRPSSTHTYKYKGGNEQTKITYVQEWDHDFQGNWEPLRWLLQPEYRLCQSSARDSRRVSAVAWLAEKFNSAIRCVIGKVPEQSYIHSVIYIIPWLVNLTQIP